MEKSVKSFKSCSKKFGNNSSWNFHSKISTHGNIFNFWAWWMNALRPPGHIPLDQYRRQNNVLGQLCNSTGSEESGPGFWVSWKRNDCHFWICLILRTFWGASTISRPIAYLFPPPIFCSPHPSTVPPTMSSPPQGLVMVVRARPPESELCSGPSSSPRVVSVVTVLSCRAMVRAELKKL